MFVAIAIVCDECFVPSLEVITEELNLTPDVAGATFMAAGGSAPEFFTSLFSALDPAPSLLGTGTIIGSAVFNVLFVIGCCAAVSPTPLELTWFPLARDSTFYAVDLVAIVCVFNDEKVMWWEALVLFILYLLYASFMVKSAAIESWFLGDVDESIPDGAAELEDVQEKDSVKEDQKVQWAHSRENREAPGELKTAGTGEELDVGTLGDRTGSNYGFSGVRPNLRTTQSSHSLAGGTDRKVFRHQSLRVVNHVVPLKKPGDSTGGSGGMCAPSEIPGSPNTQASAVEPLGCPPVVDPGATDNGMDAEPGSCPACVYMPGGTAPELCNVVPSQETKAPMESETSSDKGRNNYESKKSSNCHESDETGLQELEELEEEEEEDQPLTVALPGFDASFKEWASYLATLPIVSILVITVPDVRREGFRRFFMVTFAMSIIWIACFTWSMVYLARVIAETAEIKEHIMGITILAAGTSVPDLLTSMIVAREGQGDMAVSSSIGSNIFDVTVGLPVPWLLAALLRHSEIASRIEDEALQVSVLMLLGMLGITIAIIKCHGWSMTRWMGASMLTLYFCFMVVAVLLTKNWFVEAVAPGGSLKFIKVK
jgi:K+-dependent Na+/Ca+ exchanger-like protein